MLPSNTSVNSAVSFWTRQKRYYGDLLVVALGVFGVLAVDLAQAVTSTTMTLTPSSSSVTSGTVVTFTASVSNNGSPITTGQVTFCDATATYREDSAIIGTAQLTSVGTAAIKLVPGIGSHSYKAVFHSTTTNPGSTSTAQSVTVTGP
jgi:Bacterial Ig-like domain (group 3)